MARATGESKNMRGSVGNIVFYQSKGVTYIRTKPSRYRDAKTDKQLAARGRFTGCNRYYKLLEPDMLRHVWKMIAERTDKNPKNLFMQHNFYAFGKDSDITDYGRLQFSAGIIPMPDKLQIRRYNNRDCTVQWEYNPQEELGSPYDQLYIVELQESYRPQIHKTGANRSDSEAVFSTYQDICKYTHLYCFWGNEQKTSFSDTLYFKEIPLME